MGLYPRLSPRTHLRVMTQRRLNRLGTGRHARDRTRGWGQRCWCWWITSSSAAVGQRGRYRDISLWWGLWIAYTLLSNYAGNLMIQEGIMGDDVHQGVVPALEIVVAILGSLAFAAWVPVVRGLSQAQTEPYGLLAWIEG